MKPTKFASFPKYGTFVADEKYAEIARRLGLKAKTTAEGVQSLIEAIQALSNLSAHAGGYSRKREKTRKSKEKAEMRSKWREVNVFLFA